MKQYQHVMFFYHTAGQAKSPILRLCAVMMMFFLTGALASETSLVYGSNHGRVTTIKGLNLPPFPVFDAGKSKVKSLGWSQPSVTKIQLIYPNLLWPKKDRPHGPDHPINADFVIKFAKNLAPHQLVCIDIESWKVMTKSGLDKYECIADLIHQANPRLKLGFYGVLPIRNYFVSLKPDSAAYKKWVADNKQLRVLAKHVDVIFPSIYTFYNAPKQWQQYATANIQQARQYGKPVYPYIWPVYHLTKTRKTRTFISGDFWKLQLKTCYQHADGMVIWNSSYDKISNP